jgi:hypothetical protein
MTKTRLLATAAALALFAGAASAQELKKNEAPPAPAPAAQQKAPAEKVAPNMHAGDRKVPETTGQATKPAQADKNSAMDKSPAASGSAMEKSDNKGAAGAASAETESDSKSAADSKNSAQDKNKSTAQDKSTVKSNQSANEKSNATTGQGAASAAKLSTEQRTKITTIIRERKTPSVHLNVSVSVGTRVPANVHFYPLPAEVITIYPEWRGYDYVLVGDQIVVIDPRSHEIVAILEA